LLCFLCVQSNVVCVFSLLILSGFLMNKDVISCVVFTVQLKKEKERLQAMTKHLTVKQQQMVCIIIIIIIICSNAIHNVYYIDLLTC